MKVQNLKHDCNIALNPNDIENLCYRYLKDHGEEEEVNIEVIDYNLKPVSEDLSGFFGYHRFLTVNISKHKDKDNEKALQTIRFFTKTAPIEIESRMEYLEQFGVYKKEMSVFSEVLPKLEEIFSGISPKCYYADNTLLVLEDLNLLQYKMAAGRDGLLDYPHLKCTVKTLAAMHAASIVYEVKEKQKFNVLHAEACVENAYPLNYPKEHMRYQNFRNALKVFKEFIKLMPKYKNNLEEILNNLQTKMAVIYPMAQTSTKYQNVFSHGDMWANNVMFQYAEDGKTPIQARFVDFQLARYAPPMLDLITILTIPTSREFRSKYLMDLLMDYYTFMKEFLQQQNLSIDDFIPPEQFYESFKEFRGCGLIESCFFSHLTILPPECTENLAGSTDGFTDFFERKRVEICLKAFNTDRVYRERLTDMLEDLVDNYVLGM
ncbi:uncharacterized protein LOC119610399 [Lucilia sericata]|uniref:uncharacterized protein LOC119610399 n=1 Tax=Lucilia sericata TaxID=13632 RepID=UPI0018A85859|nr:uncharacterized protein LOC119610399 [Lucilia sericata]